MAKQLFTPEYFGFEQFQNHSAIGFIFEQWARAEVQNGALLYFAIHPKGLGQGVLVKYFACFAALFFDCSDVHATKIKNVINIHNRTSLHIEIKKPATGNQ